MALKLRDPPKYLRMMLISYRYIKKNFKDIVFEEVNMSTSKYTFEAQQELEKTFSDDRKEAMQSN